MSDFYDLKGLKEYLQSIKSATEKLEQAAPYMAYEIRKTVSYRVHVL